MSGAFISYPISVLWANSIEAARRIGDKDLEAGLASRFAEPFLPGGAKNGKCPDPCHVDPNGSGLSPGRTTMRCCRPP